MLKLCQNAKSSIQNGLCFERKQVPRIGVRPCKTCVSVYGMKWSALPYKHEVRSACSPSGLTRSSDPEKLASLNLILDEGEHVAKPFNLAKSSGVDNER